MVTSSGKRNLGLDQGRLQESLAMAFKSMSNRPLIYSPRIERVQYRCFYSTKLTFITIHRFFCYELFKFMKLETSETSNNLTTHGRRTRRLLAPPVTGFIRHKNYFWLLADLGGDERRKKGRNTLMMKVRVKLLHLHVNG
ncbi:hypothetical protein ACQ4PT_023453 [Festuca glaucescens]